MKDYLLKHQDSTTGEDKISLCSGYTINSIISEYKRVDCGYVEKSTVKEYDYYTRDLVSGEKAGGVYIKE